MAPKFDVNLKFDRMRIADMYDFEADYDTEDKMDDKWSNRHRHALHSARHFFLASHLLENLLLRDFRILRRCLAKNMQTESVLTEETIENITMQ